MLSNYDVAIANSNQAIQLNPEHPGVRQCRAMCYLHKRDYELALVDFDKVIQISPRYADAYYNRGVTYYYKRDYDRALADFDKATELNLKRRGLTSIEASLTLRKATITAPLPNTQRPSGNNLITYWPIKQSKGV